MQHQSPKDDDDDAAESCRCLHWLQYQWRWCLSSDERRKWWICHDWCVCECVFTINFKRFSLVIKMMLKKICVILLCFLLSIVTVTAIGIVVLLFVYTPSAINITISLPQSITAITIATNNCKHQHLHYNNIQRMSVCPSRVSLILLTTNDSGIIICCRARTQIKFKRRKSTKNESEKW